MVCSKRGKDHTNAHPTHYKRNRGRLLACSTVQAARRRGTYAVPTSCNHKKWKGPRPSSCLFIQVLFVGCRTFDRCFVWANRKTECIHIHVFCLLLCVVASQWSSSQPLNYPQVFTSTKFQLFQLFIIAKKKFSTNSFQHLSKDECSWRAWHSSVLPPTSSSPSCQAGPLSLFKVDICVVVIYSYVWHRASWHESEFFQLWLPLIASSTAFHRASRSVFVLYFE